MLLHPQRDQQVHTSDCRRPCAGDDHPHVGNIFLNYSQAIKNGGSTDDRRSVLVVMEDRDIHALTQFLFNIETFGRFNIFEVNAAEGRLQRRDHVDKFIRVKLIDFDVKYIDAGEFFKQNAFAFHDRLAGQRADVA